MDERSISDNDLVANNVTRLEDKCNKNHDSVACQKASKGQRGHDSKYHQGCKGTMWF